MNYVPKNLKLWKRPTHYIGVGWDGYYSAPCSQHRESDHIDRSNWQAQLRQIGGETDDGESVVIVRENHFLVGWVEWLAIRSDASEALRIADGIADRLDSYPILDENDVCEREYLEQCQEEELRRKEAEDE